MFSFTVQMEDGRVVPLLQYVVSLAVTEAIKDVCDKNVGLFHFLIGGCYHSINSYNLALSNLISKYRLLSGFCLTREDNHLNK